MPTLRQWGIYPDDAALRRHRGMDLRGLPKDRQKRGLGAMTTDNRTNGQIVAKALVAHCEDHKMPVPRGSVKKIVEALRVAGRLAGEPTPEQVEAAAKAIADCHNPGMFEKYTENWRVEARAALAAAARVPVQGEPNDDREAPVYCPVHGDLLAAPRSYRCEHALKGHEHVAYRATVPDAATEAQVLAAAKALRADEGFMAEVHSALEVSWSEYIARLALTAAQDAAPRATGSTSDGYHTFDELYEYRMLYNAHAAHGWLAAGIPVVKSWRHSDGEACFGGGWFIVTATLPSGQVSNHYKAEHWGLFKVPEVDLPPEYDGHTPHDAAMRLRIEAEHAAPAQPSSTVDEAALIREAKAEALEEAANQWAQGAWANRVPPRGSSRAQIILGVTQSAGDYLRARAAEYREECVAEHNKEVHNV